MFYPWNISIVYKSKKITLILVKVQRANILYSIPTITSDTMKENNICNLLLKILACTLTKKRTRYAQFGVQNHEVNPLQKDLASLNISTNKDKLYHL